MAGLLLFFQHHAWKNYLEGSSDPATRGPDHDPPSLGLTKGKQAALRMLDGVSLSVMPELKEG
ncbi:hypothetical protein [Acetobacter cibinongensis]|uniref:Uncharacterized protein n=1 Tax=Acetobacter cibinongensis TaxID=146475 RepID=A0A1Z5YWD4_9PROT|nr:hypothetical protein [Acetobacter cibinongensis]OUJ03338.1 hypothetical protein HK14_02680 [Acetobacter cibinongensis]